MPDLNTLFGFGGPQAGVSSQNTYAGMTPDQILMDMQRNGYTQAGVNRIYELRGLSNPPKLPAEGIRPGGGRDAIHIYGPDGKALSNSDALGMRDFFNTFGQQAVDPFRRPSAVSNLAGGILGAVGTAVAPGVFGLMQAAGSAINGNDANSSSDLGPWGGYGQILGGAYNAAGGPGSAGANKPPAGSSGGAPAGAIGESGAMGDNTSGGTSSLLGSLFGGGNANDWINTALNLYGAYNSAQGAQDSRNDLARAMQQATTTLGANTILGPGGQGASLLPNGAGGSYGVGDLEQFRQLLNQLGTNSTANAMNGGLPQNVQDAASALTGASGVPGLPDTTGMSNIFGNVLNQNLSDMNGGIQGVINNTLTNLRNQAQPFEQRAFNSLQDNQFATGRLGTTGGGLQTEAFARGLAQADTNRQLQAQQFGSDLLNQAFGRFNTTAGLANDLTQQRFGNSVLLNSTGYDRANNNLQTQIGLAQLPTALQGSQLALGLQALNGQNSISDQGLQQFQAALAQAQAAANARIGSGSNVAALAGLRAQLPSSSDIWGQVLTGIAGRNGDQNGYGSLGNLFGGLFNSSPKTPPSNNPTDPGFQGPVRP